MKSVCIAGIDTEVGKSVVSLLIAKAFAYDYWKPVQSGDLNNSDSLFIQKFAPELHILQERFRFTQAISPHAAAIHDGIDVKLSDFELPKSDNAILVESAGGIMSPISLEITNVDLFEKLSLPVILVVKNYLGSINHTLMSLKLLKQKLNVLGIIISGESNASSEEAYERLGETKILARIPKLDFTDSEVSKACADLKASLKVLL